MTREPRYKQDRPSATTKPLGSVMSIGRVAHRVDHISIMVKTGV